MTTPQSHNGIIDGYESITDYSLLEQVRDAIEDIEQHTAHTKTSVDKPIPKGSQCIHFSNHMLTQIIDKMNVKSKHTKERIKSVILELQHQENLSKQQHQLKEPIHDLGCIDEMNTDTYIIDTITAKNSVVSYEELMICFQNEIETSLCHNNILKTKEVLCTECSNEKCEIEWIQQPNIGSFMEYCPCVERIDIILKIYQKYNNNDCLWGKVSVSSIFSCDHYGFQQLVDDFLHTRIVHLDKNEENTIIICHQFEEKYKCDLRTCKVFSRHYRDRTDREKARNLYYHNDIQTQYGHNKVNDIRNDKDIIFQQELDKIHSYFLHSTLKFGKGQFYNENPCFQLRKNEINDAAKGRSYSKQSQIQNDVEEKDNDVEHKTYIRMKPMLISNNTMPHLYGNINIKHKSCGSLELDKAVLKGRGYAHTEPYSNPHHSIKTPNIHKLNIVHPHPMKYAQTAEIPNANHISQSSSSLSPTFPSLLSPTSPLNIVLSKDGIDGAMNIGVTQFSDDDDTDDEHTYMGVPEDKEWLRSIAYIDSEQEMYNRLVQFCGIFRWQNAHGFRSRHFHGLQHIQAKFNNIKEEALQNAYHQISTENWNQTLRKAKSFHNSWASKKIRAPYDARFIDQVTGTSYEWKKGTQIQLREIVTLKLYTDFDRLQFELKKCFRWEYTQEVVERNKYKDEEEEEVKGGDTARMNIDQQQKDELHNRLKHFFHWRQSLVVVLNKYGRKLTQSNRNYMLYHGVNAKMILNPAITPAFYGPLSTSASFHVAKTFATDKGMVLTLSSQYPRLGICRAFDASLISDYPEEQEWLIGFIYSRIRKIDTKESFEWMQLPPASNLRFVFFALHLFRQQIFSMSEDLEDILIEIFLERESETNKELNKDILKAKAKILRILRQKYDEFRNKPNSLQIVRLDDISRKLRPYFLDVVAHPTLDIHVKTPGIDVVAADIYEYQSMSGAYTDHNTASSMHSLYTYDEDEEELMPNYEEYRVSFMKIKNIFKNVKEIHFYNYYPCDNAVLKKFNDFVQMKANKSLKQIKFLYYDYNGDIWDNPYFFDPHQWNKMYVHNLEALGYSISHKAITNYGYKIRIYKTSDVE